MFYTYPAIVHEGENGGYWAEFVDFNAFTQGDTLGELISHAEEAMVCHIEEEVKNGSVLPVPSDIRRIRVGKDAFATLVHVAVPSPSSKENFLPGGIAAACPNAV